MTKTKIRECIGDAIIETSTNGSGSTSWNTDNSQFILGNRPFVLRGGYYGQSTDAGSFTFNRTYGEALHDYGFRAVICPK